MTGEEILALDLIAKEPITIPEWGGEYMVHALTAEQRDAMEQENYLARKANGGDVNPTMRARMAVATLHHPTGKPVFGPSAVAKLGKQPATILDRIWDAAIRLSGMGAEAEQEAKKD